MAESYLPVEYHGSQGHPLPGEVERQSAEGDHCTLCGDEVETAQQHFIRLTSPLMSRCFLLCVECWASFMHELDGTWDGKKVIDI